MRGAPVWSSNRDRLPLTDEVREQPMGRRTFEMIDLVELYVHWDAGRSQAQLAQSLGLDRKTVRKYLAPVRATGLTPGGPPVMSEADWRERAGAWFPEVVDKGLRQVTLAVWLAAVLAASIDRSIDAARTASRAAESTLSLIHISEPTRPY